MAKYERHLRRVPMLASKLTGQRLHKRHVPLLCWARWVGSVGPAVAAGTRPGLLQVVQDMGQWPGVLAKRYTSLIPKPGEAGPLGTHPLAVVSMVYQLWARGPLH